MPVPAKTKAELLLDIDKLYAQLQHLINEVSRNKRARHIEVEKVTRQYDDRHELLVLKITSATLALSQLITRNKKLLHFGEIGSFATRLVTVSWRTVTTGYAITDTAGLIEYAKRHGLLDEVARPQVTYVVDQKKLVNFLWLHPDRAPELASFITEHRVSTEQLMVAPNVGETDPIILE